MECSKEIEKMANELRKSKKHFCSSSCSASHNNKLRRDNTRNILCENCNNIFNKTKDKRTNTCSMLCYMELGMKNRLMKDSINRSGANTYDNIRCNARLYSKYFYPLECMLCGYNKHYEVCHVKDLKDFTREETIYEINHKTNLIHLCPNCHWEFDKNILNINTIREAQNKYL